MIGVEIRFLTGRFHANDWSRAHNEGVPEWPPSPWRVLRAFVAAAYAEGIPASQLEPVLAKLAGVPRYRLPAALEAHTRHYMPDTSDAAHTRAKVFDAFVAVDGGARAPAPVTIAWPVELSDRERDVLAQLARRISYLGRAESWAELTVTEVSDGSWDCWPDEDVRGPATALLALAPTEAFNAWAADQPRPKKGRDVPRTLWDVLTFDGERFRDEGWSEIPGTRRVRYVFSQPPFRRAGVAHRVRATARPTVARYAIRSAVLPRLHEAVAIGERIRVAAMSSSRRIAGDARPVFSGHGDEVVGHRHAMYLSMNDNRAPLHISEIMVSASAGFSDEDVRALQQIRRVWGRDGHDLELVLIGLGAPEDFGGLRAPQSPVLAESHVWTSLTPFVPTRHPKVVRGALVDGYAEQIARACEQILNVRPIEVTPAGSPHEWQRFRRRRVSSGGGQRGPDRAIGARLVFDRPVRGPIAIGYGCHFGLGLFVPERRS